MASNITSELPVQQSGTGHCVSTMQPMRRRCSTSLTRSLSGGCTTCTRKPRRSRRIWIATSSSPPRCSGVKQLQIVDRPVVEALHHAVRIGLHAHPRIPYGLKPAVATKPRDPRPEIGVVILGIDPHASLRCVELGVAQIRQHLLWIITAAFRDRP